MFYFAGYCLTDRGNIHTHRNEEINDILKVTNKSFCFVWLQQIIYFSHHYSIVHKPKKKHWLKIAGHIVHYRLFDIIFWRRVLN